MLKCRICGREAYVDGRCECARCRRTYYMDDVLLRRENIKLRIALHDAINRPMGVVPESAEEFLRGASNGRKDVNR